MDAALVTLDGADHELLCHEDKSIYPDVCVPALAGRVTPVTMAVGEVDDSDYCFDRALTISEETSTVVRRDVCNYVYEQGFICIQCELAYPAPVEICVTGDMAIWEDASTVDRKGIALLPAPSTWSTTLPTTWYITLTTSRLHRTHSIKT